jgi:hypothetical protein
MYESCRIPHTADALANGLSFFYSNKDGMIKMQCSASAPPRCYEGALYMISKQNMY